MKPFVFAKRLPSANGKITEEKAVQTHIESFFASSNTIWLNPRESIRSRAVVSQRRHFPFSRKLDTLARTRFRSEFSSQVALQCYSNQPLGISLFSRKARIRQHACSRLLLRCNWIESNASLSLLIPLENSERIVNVTLWSRVRVSFSAEWFWFQTTNGGEKKTICYKKLALFLFNLKYLFFEA